MSAHIRDLKQRGLDGSSVKLGPMDGLSGLTKVFQEEFTHGKMQWCRVHVARNVLVKVPQAKKREVADDVRSIFYASSRPKAEAFYKEFHEKWNSVVPFAVKSLDNSLDSCLTFLSFPEEEWISLRATNVIERLNKEFKRRTKPMEIVAGEHACYRLLAFISLKMGLSWRTTKVGKATGDSRYHVIDGNGKCRRALDAGKATVTCLVYHVAQFDDNELALRKFAIRIAPIGSTARYPEILRNVCLLEKKDSPICRSGQKGRA